MTFILGAHLTRKLYLVSDTRLTFADGRTEDNFIKAVVLNKRIALVAAGNVSLASYIAKEIKKRIRGNSSASYINCICKNDLELIVKEYVDKTGRVNESASFIFAGYNLNRPKIVNSGRLGKVMSATVKSRGEGVVVNQSIDPAITHALANSIRKSGGYLHSQDIVIPDILQTEMTTLQIRTSQNALYISPLEQIAPYDYAVFHPQHNIEKAEIPIEVLSEIDFRILEDEGKKESFLYRDASIMGGFILKVSSERKFTSIGGNILVLLVTPEGCIMPTGDMIIIRDGKPSLTSLYVEDGAMCYRLPDGRTGQYHYLESPHLAGDMQAI